MATNYAQFQKFCIRVKKRGLQGRQRSYFILSASPNREKNLSAEVKVTKRLARVLLKKGKPKVNFFAEKFSNFGPVPSKLMKLKRVTDGGSGYGVPSHWANFCDRAAKNNNFNGILITFLTF